MDLLSNYNFDQVCRLVELRKHLCASDRHAMVDHIIHQLSIGHLFEALELCNEPTAKACRLCRIRRYVLYLRDSRVVVLAPSLD